MRISTKIRYGTRAILELASHYGKGPVDLKEIAKKENISLKYLEQVIIPLKSAGLLKAIRGAKGGYSLAKPPSEISLNDVVKVLDGPVDLVECIKDPDSCPKSSTCITRDIWKEASEALEKVFSAITFEEMLRRRKEREEKSPPMYQI
ncbi:MAG: Rrf2 family transcriptional regulator [Desulfobacterota bacterium]|nr:Rrf2 family transcriptional regulator [Thermodesulfobacteriota bacterium]